MTKSDLKSGMIVTNRDGERFRVFLNSSYNNGADILVGINKNTWMNLENFSEDLTHYRFFDLDIIKIEKCSVYEFNDPHSESLSLLWERNQVKEMTIAEIEELVGCKVKIVKGDNND